jgi:hypothetical protein
VWVFYFGGEPYFLIVAIIPYLLNKCKYLIRTSFIGFWGRAQNLTIFILFGIINKAFNSDKTGQILGFLKIALDNYLFCGKIYLQSNKRKGEIMKNLKLKFSHGNQKLHELAEYLGIPKCHVLGFDLPAGHTCPFAKECLAKADKVTGKITDGKNMKFRCYATQAEASYPNCRKARWHNFDAIENCKTSDEIAKLINSSLPKTVEIIRIHSSGDFYKKMYFDAWVKVAKQNPDLIFFGYTKAIQYVDAVKPDNFKLVYSYGGKLDNLVTEKTPVSYVVSKDYKGDLPLPCEETGAGDYFSILNGETFGLVIHGTQPAKV